MITVVIPYYQKSAGVLARVLASIAAQHPCGLPVHVIVVDDASPAPAGPEVATLGATRFTVEVITQANGGPGAARNTGLNHAPVQTRFIAFLDSDDEWTPDHLARAVAALESGYDFYFADHYQLDQHVSAFARAGRIDLAQHDALAGQPDGLFAYRGDMLDQIIRGNIIGTPTVVYDFHRFKHQRFRVEFTNVGEDYLFWMELADSNARIAFSSQPEVTCGRGVNVYAGSGWGSEQHLLRVHNELKYRKTTAKLFTLSPAQQNHVDQSIRDLRTAFIRDVIHRISHRKVLPGSLLSAHFKLDPMTFILAPVIFLKMFASRLRT